MLAAALLLSACSPKAQSDQGNARELVKDYRGLPVGIVLSALTDLTPVDNAQCKDIAERSTSAIGYDLIVSDVRAWSFSDRIVPALAGMTRAAKEGGITDFADWYGELELAQEIESTGDYSMTSMTFNGYVHFISQTVSNNHVEEFWVLMREAVPHKIVCTWKRGHAAENETDSFVGIDDPASGQMDLEHQE